MVNESLDREILEFWKECSNKWAEELDHIILSGVKSTFDTSNSKRFYIFARLNPDSYVWSMFWHNYYLRSDAEQELERWLDQHYPDNWYRNNILANVGKYYRKDTEELIARISRTKMSL